MAEQITKQSIDDDDVINANTSSSETKQVDSIDSPVDPDEQPDVTEPSLEQKLADTQAEVSKHQDMALRHLAELENVRKRAAKDIEAAHKFATEKFAKELLNVVDSMELGLKAADEPSVSIDSLKEGVSLTIQQLYRTFENLNIEIIDADGLAFNPDLHEAMTTVENPDVEPNTVINVIQKGYTLNGRLLRPARVIVSKK